jgi:DNA-binding HxlR family transcriptional regulator
MNVQRLGATAAESVQPHGCPVMAFQAMISGKYKIRILWDLKDGPRRYSEIRTGLLTGAMGTREIAPRVLSRELKALAEAGMIARKDYGLVPPKVEYRLTEAGARFVPVIAEIRDWGERHLAARPPDPTPGSGSAVRPHGRPAPVYVAVGVDDLCPFDCRRQI